MLCRCTRHTHHTHTPGTSQRTSTGDQAQATCRDTFLLPASASPCRPPARTGMPPSPCAPATYSRTLVCRSVPRVARVGSAPRHTLHEQSLSQQPGRSFARDHMAALLTAPHWSSHGSALCFDSSLIITTHDRCWYMWPKSTSRPFLSSLLFPPF
jgi:hypothetical protein